VLTTADHGYRFWQCDLSHKCPLQWPEGRAR